MTDLKQVSNLLAEINEQPIEIKEIINKCLKAELRDTREIDKQAKLELPKTIVAKPSASKCKRKNYKHRSTLAVEQKVIDFLKTRESATVNEIKESVLPEYKLGTVYKVVLTLFKNVPAIKRTKENRVFKYSFERVRKIPLFG